MCVRINYQVFSVQTNMFTESPPLSTLRRGARKSAKFSHLENRSEIKRGAALDDGGSSAETSEITDIKLNSQLNLSEIIILIVPEPCWMGLRAVAAENGQQTNWGASAAGGDVIKFTFSWWLLLLVIACFERDGSRASGHTRHCGWLEKDTPARQLHTYIHVHTFRRTSWFMHNSRRN